MVLLENYLKGVNGNLSFYVSKEIDIEFLYYFSIFLSLLVPDTIVCAI